MCIVYPFIPSSTQHFCGFSVLHIFWCEIRLFRVSLDTPHPLSLYFWGLSPQARPVEGEAPARGLTLPECSTLSPQAQAPARGAR